jgi:uncharacterized protein YndB with AHSA1/START domain
MNGLANTAAARHAGRVAGNGVDIAAPAKAVFDYVTDLRREPEWNPQMRDVQKLTHGPIGAGTTYRVRFGRGVGMATIENTAFDRPRYWSAMSRSPRLDVRAEGSVVETAPGCRLSVRTELQPRGLLYLLAPVLGQVMRRSWEQDLRRIKTIMESSR